jgi:CheY-like chemotaxis protein
MPGGMNGVDLVREIRARRRDLPVLLTSGYAEAAKKMAEAEGVRVLPKPYRLDELARALMTTLRNSGSAVS